MQQFKQPKFRKPRLTSEFADGDAWSSQARSIGKKIGWRQYADVLSQLDTLLSDEDLPIDKRTQVLSFAADVVFAQGKFDQAADIYSQAIALNRLGLDGWLRAVIGQVRSLLRLTQVVAAQNIAQQAVVNSVATWQDYLAAIAALENGLNQAGSVRIPPRPPRPSVVTSRFAQQFFDEGEIALATNFWQQALQIEPDGATRARIGLARIALRSGQLAVAANWAVSGLQTGLYRQKTLDAWPLLIKANAQQGITTLDQNLLNGLNGVGSGVRARAVLIIVQTLRVFKNPQWLSIATGWMQGNPASSQPIIAAELQKLVLAENVRRKDLDFATRLATASTLLAIPNLSSAEMLLACKEQVRSACDSNVSFDWNAAANRVATAHGEFTRFKFLYGIAGAYLRNGRPELAVPILNNLTATKLQNFWWGRAMWMLAQINGAAGDHVNAAVRYQTIATDSTVDPRFRVQAKLRWIEHLLQTESSTDIVAAIPGIQSILATVTDYNVLLDFARQLQSAPDELSSLKEQVYSQGEGIALARYATLINPDEKINLLHKLSRRQKDFEKFDLVITMWESLSPNEVSGLWSEKSVFWEYLSNVYFSYAITGRGTAAETFAWHYFNDPATPDTATPLWICYGLQKIRERQLSAAFTALDTASARAPGNPQCAYAYYWSGIKNLCNGELAEAASAGSKIQSVLVGSPVAAWKQYLVAASMYFQNNGIYRSEDFSAAGIRQDEHAKLQRQIAQDLSIVS